MSGIQKIEVQPVYTSVVQRAVKTDNPIWSSSIYHELII